MPNRPAEPAPERAYERLNNRIDRLEDTMSYFYDVIKELRELRESRFDAGEEIRAFRSEIEQTAGHSRKPWRHHGLDPQCHHYQHCRQTQNCHCEKYHRVGRHMCQKFDHLSLPE